MTPDSLDLRKLRAFNLVARHGSLRIAAARLNLTVPAVSLQIRKLEEELGIALFRRLPNKLVLTREGEAFLIEVEGIFERVEHALGTLSSHAATTGRLSLAMGNDFTWYFAPRIGNFIRRFPSVELNLQIGRAVEVMADLERGALDVGLGVFHEFAKGVHREVVAESGIALVCAEGHPLLTARTPGLADIARHRLLVAPRHALTRQRIDRTFRAAGVTPRSYLEAGNCPTALAFAARGIGVAIVHSLCAGHLAERGLRVIDLTQHFGTIEIYAAYRRGKAPTPALGGLLEALTATPVGAL